MKIAAMTGAALTALAAASVALPTTANAQTYYSDCRAHERSDGTAGAVIGGIAGALLGSSVAPHHGNRAGGAAIGGVAGALLGNSIGRSAAKSNSGACGSYAYDGYYADPDYSYAAPPTYYAPAYSAPAYEAPTYYAPTYDAPAYSYGRTYYPY